MTFNIEAFRQNEEEFREQFNRALNMGSSDEEELPNYDADILISEENDEVMKTLTNFDCQQFSVLYNQVEPFLNVHHSGGRKSKLSIKTMFLITICFCKHALSFKILGTQFGLDSSYLERIVWSTISICHNVLFNFTVKWFTQEENEREISQTLFDYFPNAICAVVASVQEISRPKKNQSIWYSGKHKKHCIKIQAAISPRGLLIDLKGPVQGPVHDFLLFQNSDLVSKLNSERNRYMTLNPNKPAITALFDKGYIGIKNIFPGAELPYKKFRHQQLTQQQEEHNRKV